MNKGILTVIDSKDTNPKERIKLENKDLSQLTLPEYAKVLGEMLSIVEENEELTDEEKSIVDKINLSAEQKALAWGWVIKNIQEAQEVIVHENKLYAQKMDDNKKRFDVLQNRANNRAKFLYEMMKKLGKTKIEGANYLVRLRKLPQKVELKKDLEEIDYSKYPGCFKEIPAKHEPIKAEMKKWLESNESDDFCLSEPETKLEIK
jgi:hypothetical protein